MKIWYMFYQLDSVDNQLDCVDYQLDLMTTIYCREG